MEEYIIALSKYAIAFFIAGYTYECFSVFRLHEEKKRKGIYTRQILFMFFMHFTCFLTICIKTGDMQYLFFYGFQQLTIFAILVLMELIYPKANRLLVNNSCMLLTIGFIMITRLDFKKAIRQYIIAMISVAIAMLIPFLIKKIRNLKDFTWYYAGAGILALALVYILGSVTHGSKISYTIFHITFQPSELVKILFVFFVAAALWEKNDWKRVLLASSLAAGHVLILVFSKDLGSALIYFVAYVFMIYFATGKKRYLFLGILGFITGSVVAYPIFSHVRVRVQAFLDPWSVIDGEGFQITQSLFSLGRGSAFGLGLFQGAPGDIPYVEQDFMFSAIAEELGLIFAFCLILICLSCFLMFMNISLHLKDGFYCLLSFGFGILYIFQVFLTIGGGVRFIPLTGVTLPLVSYGGTSVLSMLLVFSIVEGLSMEPYKKERKKSENPGKPAVPVASFLYVGLFLALMIYVSAYVYFFREPMINNSYNAGQQMLVKQNRRGRIFAADGTVLAETRKEDDGSEVRYYPQNNLYAHVVGYSTKGKTGIEALANYQLIQSDVPIYEKVEYGMQDEKNPGNDVYTTLDPKLQEMAWKALGVYEGAIIVTEPSTGKILAMVSKPDYDPNEISKIWENLISKEDESGLLVNRATQGLYPPGSTFKMYTALEYIRENPETYGKYKFNCSGSFTKDGTTIRCFHGTKHGNVDFLTSFAKSCNSSFANIGSNLDWDRFSKELDKLYFGKKMPVGLECSISRIEASSDESMEDKLQTSIGQGTTAVTPMQIHLLTSAIANRGVLQYPYVLEKSVTANGSTVKKYGSGGKEKLLTPLEADLLTACMKEVVESGTATRLKGYSYTVAGKTGSAEYNKKGDSHAWFTGFAPVNNPQLCVTVILEGAGTGGDLAVPVARRIFSDYLE